MRQSDRSRFLRLGQENSRNSSDGARGGRRKHMALRRGPAPIPAGPTERWAMDFVHDALADGRPFRILTVVDQWSRSSPLLEVASRMSGDTVGEALDRLLEDAPRPRSIYRRSWHRIPVAGARRLGVSPRGAPRLHPPRQTRGKRKGHLGGGWLAGV